MCQADSHKMTSILSTKSTITKKNSHKISHVFIHHHRQQAHTITINYNLQNNNV